MRVREAVLTDVPQIVAMGRRFITETDYRDTLTVNVEQLDQIARQLIDRDETAILVAEGPGGALLGMIALYHFVHPFSAQSVVTELVWWSQPEDRRCGVRLLRAAEQWAVHRGAELFHMVAPTARVAAFYERLQYHRVETMYQRRLVPLVPRQEAVA